MKKSLLVLSTFVLFACGPGNDIELVAIGSDTKKPLALERATKPKANNITFTNKSKFYGAQLTSGAIFNTSLDLSHPINYGFYKNNLSVFRNTNIFIENDSLSFNNPIKYTNTNTLISGYISEENYKSMKDSRPFVNFKIKKGNINVFSDNTNFRGFWFGTNKLFMNAIFFSKIM